MRPFAPIVAFHCRFLASRDSLSLSLSLSFSLSLGNPTPRIVLSSVNAAEIVYVRFYDNRERDVAVKLCRCPVSRTVVTRIALQRRSVSRQATARYRFPLAEKRVQRTRIPTRPTIPFASRSRRRLSRCLNNFADFTALITARESITGAYPVRRVETASR